MVDAPPVLEVRGITKRFPGVLANDNIDLSLHKGKVLGLLGENGAGKSTLMNVIYGLYKPDEGEVLIDGRVVDIQGSKNAIELGIGMVHQHFQLVDTLTVNENVMLGNESVIGSSLPDSGANLSSAGITIFMTMLLKVVGIVGFLRRGVTRKQVVEISEQYGLYVDPDALIADLPVGIQQRVEIIKALYRHANILILDEPTAVLTPQETLGLFDIMRTLLARGVSIIFITHKLKEILEICDDVIVLRHGKVVGYADPKNSTEQSLASLMVGRDVLLEVEKTTADPGDNILKIEKLNVRDDRDLPAVEDLSLEIRAGEILGVAGVQGNGQTELVEAITGLRNVVSGKISVGEKDITGKSPRSITESGTAHIPENRQKNGMVAAFSVKDNMVLCNYYRSPFANGIVINEPALEENAENLVKEYDVRTPSIFVEIDGLSGGNQQKVIVARELSRHSQLLLAAQPTRGLDVGSIEFMHKQIIRMRDEGVAVLLVSTELDEILSLSDRVAVMFEGEIIDVLPIEQADRDTVGLRMAGIRG